MSTYRPISRLSSERVKVSDDVNLRSRSVSYWTFEERQRKRRRRIESKVSYPVSTLSCFYRVCPYPSTSVYVCFWVWGYDSTLLEPSPNLYFFKLPINDSLAQWRRCRIIKTKTDVGTNSGLDGVVVRRLPEFPSGGYCARVQYRHRVCVWTYFLRNCKRERRRCPVLTWPCLELSYRRSDVKWTEFDH